MSNTTKFIDSGLREKCDKLCEDIRTVHIKNWGEDLYPDYKAYYTVGKKYLKVIITYERIFNSGNGLTVWGFINLDNPKFQYGDVLKAASWNAPALNKSRGNLFQGYDINYSRQYGPDYLVNRGGL